MAERFSEDKTEDKYPELARVITHRGMGDIGRPVSIQDLTGKGNLRGADQSIGGIMAQEGGECGIKNQRIREWVSLQIISALLASNTSGIIEYEIWLSRIQDDILRHTDAILKATTLRGSRYYSIDLTCSEDELWKKSDAHDIHSDTGVYVGQRQMRIPHLILYTQADVVYAITGALERLIKNGIIPDRKTLRSKLVSAFLHPDEASRISISMTLADPDSRNHQVTLPIDREVTSHFMKVIGAKHINQTLLRGEGI